MKCERCHCDLPKGNVGLVWHLAHGNQASVCEDCYSALKQLELDSVSRGFQDVAEESDDVNWAQKILYNVKLFPGEKHEPHIVVWWFNEFIRRFRAKEAELAEVKARYHLVHCAYCGAEFDMNTDDEPEKMHIWNCKKHPIHKLKAELATAKCQLDIAQTAEELQREIAAKFVHESDNAHKEIERLKAQRPAPDAECEELAQICIASAQYQEATCTSTPGTFSSKACRRIAAILRSMNPAKRHKIEWWFPEGNAMFGARGCGREYHSENLQAALGYILWLCAKDLGIDITERKEPTK